MKGIAGIVYPDVFQVNHLIFPMLDVLQNGNDSDRDIHTFNNIQIGSVDKKLAVNEKKTIIGGFDGTIYNTTELHKDLVRHGYHFLTEDPTEVLIHAYELWGTKFIERIEGDFAIMILDPLKERIILARDRIGKKPLYWYHSNNHFIFGSQLKSLLATGVIPQAPAADAISSYFFFGYFPQDLTPIKSVNKLLPGHILQYNFNQSKTIEPYWSYSSYFENPTHKHPNTLSKLLNTHLEESVTHQMPSAKEIGCFVSGGLGSASVAYYLKKMGHNKHLTAYSVGFEDENRYDIETAVDVANTLGIDHKTRIITPENFLDNITKIIWHLDEPISDPNIIATWELSALASLDVKHVFSGMGSDEFLAGHNRYTLKEQQIDAVTKAIEISKPFVYKFLVPIVNMFYKPLAYRLLKESRTDPWQFEYLKQNALFPEHVMKKACPKLAGLFDPEVFLHKFHHINRVQSSVSSFLYFDVKTRLADNYMLQYDRITSAHHLSWRTPFLERSLIEFLASLPEPESLTEDETASYLKRLMQDRLPSSVVQRAKKTRRNFIASWIEKSSFHEICKQLEHGTLVETGIISREWLRLALSTPERRVASFKYLWAVFTLEMWFQLFINRPITPGVLEIPVNRLLLENERK
jgi:asparagine synthase (glutamine-hydrolysing)